VVAVRRGDVVLVNLDPTVGVEIKKTRPAIVISNDSINHFSQLVVVVPLTKNTAHISPSHAVIPKGTARLAFTSKVVTEQIKAVDKQRIVRRLGNLSPRSSNRLSVPSRIPWPSRERACHFGFGNSDFGLPN
jgi:mRNA interferase MazF